MMADTSYKRIVLKISGESLCRPGGFGIAPEQLEAVSESIAGVRRLGIETAVVVGGGNFIRGAAFSASGDTSRNTADYMGMLATIMNACAVAETLGSAGCESRVLSAIPVPEVAETFTARTTMEHLASGRVVLLAGGTGNPFFTTDTCAALRAAQIGAELLIKATKVDGVYSADPKIDPDARLLERLSYSEVISKDLRVMDHAAVSLCRDNGIKIVVLNIFKAGNIDRALCGEHVGTVVTS